VTALLEHEAKSLLRRAGLAVPEGEVASDAPGALAAGDGLGYPVALKAQVRSGHRADRGLIARADDAHELLRAADGMLGREVDGERVVSVLVERWQELAEEWYLAVVSDTTVRRPCLLTSRSGGTGVEHLDGGLVRSVLPADVQLTLWELRGLARRHGGFEGGPLLAFADVLGRLLEVYRSNDAWLVEVNPLGRTAEGGWLAVDAKIRLDGDALLQRPAGERPEGVEVLYADRAATEREREAVDLDRRDHRGSVHYVEIDPGGVLAREEGRTPIAMHCVGTGASLTLMDELAPAGFRPVDFCDSSGSPSAEKVDAITRIVLGQDAIEGYLFFTCLATQELTTTAEGLIRAFRAVAVGGPVPFPVLLVFRGNLDDEALRMIEQAGAPFDGPYVGVAGRDMTERQAAQRFAELHAAWKAGTP
jgi:succinyl-CoA synthetase beta subunit